MSTSNFDGDYSLTSVLIDDLEIKELVTELSIYESVNSVSISVEIMITDSKNILASIPINGYEVVTVTVSTKGSTFKIPLILYKISNRVIEEKSQIFIIHCISYEAVINESSRFSIRFKNKYPHDIVKDLLKNRLKTSKKIDIDLSLFHINFINPNWRIFDTITWLSRRTVPDANQNSCGYLFYESLTGFNFKSIDNLFYQSSQNINTPFVYAPANTAKSVNKYRIVKLLAPDYFDHFETLRCGGFSHYVVKIDLSNRSKTTTKSNINDFWKYSTHLGNTAAYDTNLVHQPTRLLVRPSINNLFGDNQNVIEPDRINELMNRAIYRYQLMDAISINIQIAGNLDIRIGNIYSVLIPSTNSDNTNNRERQNDDRLSGNYMLHSLRTTINRTTSFTICKLVKDSFASTNISNTINNNFIDVPLTNVG